MDKSQSGDAKLDCQRSTGHNGQPSIMDRGGSEPKDVLSDGYSRDRK
jgi:hypothetical protein